MKKIISYATAIIFSLFIISSQACSKKKEDTQTNDCKICKAFASGPDQSTVEKEVCTPEEEQTFRSQHTGQEISCHQ